MPLLRPETLTGLVDAHEAAGAAATILTAERRRPVRARPHHPRPATGAVDAIVEERDATPDQRAISEINAGVYAFDAALLRQALGKLTTAQRPGRGVPHRRRRPARRLGPTRWRRYTAGDPSEVLGCNDRVELAALRAVLRDRVNDELDARRRHHLDPATTWIDVTVTLGRDAVIEPNTHLRGAHRGRRGRAWSARTPRSIDTSVGDGAQRVRTHGSAPTIGAGRQRRAVRLPAARAPIWASGQGRARSSRRRTPQIGEGSEGAAPVLRRRRHHRRGDQHRRGHVFVNYDGVAKHRTTIGSHVRTGCDTMLVAPVDGG